MAYQTTLNGPGILSESTDKRLGSIYNRQILAITVSIQAIFRVYSVKFTIFN